MSVASSVAPGKLEKTNGMNYGTMGDRARILLRLPTSQSMSKQKHLITPIPGDRCLAAIAVYGFDPAIESLDLDTDPYPLDSYRIVLLEFYDARGYTPSGWVAVREMLRFEHKKRKAAHKRTRQLAKLLEIPALEWEQVQPLYLGELPGMQSHYDFYETRFFDRNAYLEVEQDREDYPFGASLNGASADRPGVDGDWRLSPERNGVERRLLGYVAVDCGMVAIADPSYLNLWQDNLPDGSDRAQDFSFSGAHNATHHTEAMGGQLYAPFPNQDAVLEAIAQGRTPLFEAGVAVSTGIGDGTYPVYAEYQDLGQPFGKRIVRVTVDFTHHILLQDTLNFASTTD
ncbi:MAG: DUF4241 domain-containing protein [Cyanobacteria bacterium J007]|nr:MAG: DUF4241 domain-containing protein [Cyanobacteria bacterium J007]